MPHVSGRACWACMRTRWCPADSRPPHIAQLLCAAAGEGAGLDAALWRAGRHLPRAHRWAGCGHLFTRMGCGCCVKWGAARLHSNQVPLHPRRLAHSTKNASLTRTSCTSLPPAPSPTRATCAGDTDREGLEGLDSADIICATPEKFDAVTRSGMRFFADIGLVLIGGCCSRSCRAHRWVLPELAALPGASFHVQAVLRQLLQATCTASFHPAVLLYLPICPRRRGAPAEREPRQQPGGRGGTHQGGQQVRRATELTGWHVVLSLGSDRAVPLIWMGLMQAHSRPAHCACPPSPRLLPHLDCFSLTPTAAGCGRCGSRRSAGCATWLCRPPSPTCGTWLSGWTHRLLASSASVSWEVGRMARHASPRLQPRQGSCCPALPANGA